VGLAGVNTLKRGRLEELVMHPTVKITSAESGTNVLIAWNCSTEQARATAFAMPILKRASRVAVLTVKGGAAVGRHRWLGRVARDEKLPGAALRTAVLLWELQNADRGCAWPSLTYIAAQLQMHKSTVIRSLSILSRRGWITTAHRGGRHRTNEYRIGFGSIDEEDAAS
jgi:hypothetical protein